MRFARIPGAVLVIILFCSIRTAAADPRELARMLSDAEKIRPTDKVKSRQLLDVVQRALEAAPDPALRAQAQLLECTWADEPTVAYRAVELGLPFADDAKSSVLRARLLICRGAALQFDSRSREAETAYATAIVLAVQAKEGAVEADARSKLGWLQYNRGAMADALTNLQASYRISARLKDEKMRLDALSIMANVYADAGVAQYDRAIEYYRQLLAAYEKHGRPNDVADTLFNIGSTFETKGNQAAAEQHYIRALAAFETLRMPRDIAYTRRALGSSLMKQGRLNDALAYFDAALAFFEEANDLSGIAFVKQFRGSAYRRLHRAEDALRDLAASREFFETEKNARFLEKNVDETALVYEQLGDLQNAYAFRKRHTELQQELAASRRDELASRLRIQFDAEQEAQKNRARAIENALRAAAVREAERSRMLRLAVMALAALLAIALAVLFWRQVAHARRMRAMAMTDELTRLPNRRHIMAVVENAFAEARRNQHPAAVIVLDIDRFKRINDTHGHAAGDEILKRIARTCRMALRPSDHIGRIGGEEFLIVLQQPTTAAQAFDIAERLRTAVEQLDVSSIAAGLQVTISLGVCVTSESDATAAIAAADALLYRAKKAGRNRVEMAAAQMES